MTKVICEALAIAIAVIGLGLFFLLFVIGVEVSSRVAKGDSLKKIITGKY